MKLDWQIIRTLLGKFEDESIRDFIGTVGLMRASIRLEDFEKRETAKKEAEEQEKIVFGHLLLCLDGGFIEGMAIRADGDFRYSYGFHSPRLTLRGHELLEKLRCKTVWEKIRSGADALGVPLTVETISAIAARVIGEV